MYGNNHLTASNDLKCLFQNKKPKSFVRNFLVKFWIVHVRLLDTLEKYEVENLILLPLEVLHNPLPSRDTWARTNAIKHSTEQLLGNLLNSVKRFPSR